MPYDKSDLPSRHVSVGPARAPHRSYYYAMGMTEEEIARPFVGVATTWNEAAPCNIALARQAQSVKLGVKAGGVTVQDVFEAVGQHGAGTMSDKDLHELECVACPSAGACGGQFTANTMACVSEAIGLALPGSAGAPAPYESRDAYAVASGEAVMKLIEKKLRPRAIGTLKAF